MSRGKGYSLAVYQRLLVVGKRFTLALCRSGGGPRRRIGANRRRGVKTDAKARWLGDGGDRESERSDGGG